MDIKLFSDLIDALGKVMSGLKTITNLPKAERDQYRATIEDTFRLIDTTLNMVIIRLGDIQLEQNKNEFLNEVMKLDNWDEWLKVEREFRLCRSLRVAVREADDLIGKLRSKVSTKDWELVLELMRGTLCAEHEVAEYVGDQFRDLANAARLTNGHTQDIQTIRAQVQDFRDAMNGERRNLIRLESELYENV